MLKQKVIVNINNLNLRKSPNMDNSSIIGTCPMGEYDVLDTKNNFAKINKGWVHLNFVEIKEVESNNKQKDNSLDIKKDVKEEDKDE